MSAPADAWVPVPLRWRHVRPGDVIVGRENVLWNVWGSREAMGRWAIDAFGMATVYGDPDDVVNVLIPVPERDAAGAVRDELAATLVERRAG